MNKHIARITMPVSNQERAIEFYTWVFGMSSLCGSQDRFENWNIYSGNSDDKLPSAAPLIDSGNLIALELSEQLHSAQSPERTGMDIADESINRLIVVVASMQEITNQLVTAGGTVTALFFDIDPGNPIHAIATDPDGNVLELVEAASLLQDGQNKTIIGIGLTTRNLPVSLKELCGDHGFSPCDDKFNHTQFWSRDNTLVNSQTITRDGMYLLMSQYSKAGQRNSRPARALNLAFRDPVSSTDSS